MLSMRCFLERSYDIDRVLTEEDKQLLREENHGKNVSYISLMNEMLRYKNRTIRDLLHGWGGVTLFKI